jgi:hypothetical protein
MPSMKSVVGGFLIAWFVLLAGLILVASICVLLQTRNWPIATAIPNPPAPPTSPADLPAYVEATTAYEKQVAAFKDALETAPKLLAPYERVVKETLADILKVMLGSLLGYVFVKAAANAITNVLQKKAGQDITPLTFW